MDGKNVSLYVYNFPTNITGDVMFGMFKELGVNKLYIDSAFSRFYFYTEYGEDIDAITEQLDQYMKELNAYFVSKVGYEAEYEIVVDDITESEKDKINNDLGYFEPYKVLGDIWICPKSHDSETIDPSKLDGYKPTDISITLKTPCVNGDGKHPTSQLLLWGIRKYASGKEINHSLDIGSGSGISSVYLGKVANVKDSIFCDQSTIALSDTTSNMKLNGLDANNPMWRTAISLDKISDDIDFDIITSNIPLTKETFKQIVSKVHSNTKLLLTGFYITKISEIMELISNNGLQIEDSMHIDRWTLFVCSKI